MSSPIGVSPKGPAGRTGRRGRSRISRKVTTAAILPGGRSVYPSALSAIVGSSGGIDSVLLWTRFLELVPRFIHWPKVAHERRARPAMDARVDWRSDEAGAAPRVKARMLPGAPGLEFVEAEPDFAPPGAPVLFVHGAFAGAWMWREVFMPFFARRGRACAAVSLRGHGASEGRAGLRAARLSDYRDDLQRAFAALPEPPVVVAHSLGGLLAQQLIGREEMRALALLASLPPEGLWLESPRLAITDPHIWLEAVAGSAAGDRRPIGMAAHEVL